MDLLDPTGNQERSDTLLTDEGNQAALTERHRVDYRRDDEVSGGHGDSELH